MKISFYGAAETVTGSCHLLECSDINIMVDCGMFQGGSALSDLNDSSFEFDINKLDAMILTHAHIDHSGRLPKLVKDGFSGKVYLNEATASLCEVMLMDSAHIQEMEAEYRTRKNARKGLPPAEPMYSQEDAEECIKSFVPLDYDVNVKLSQNVSFTLRDAGHMLGSCIIEIWDKDEKIVFSGDLGNLDKPLLNNPTLIKEADYVVMESTYGGRFHSYKKKEDQLLEIILKTAKRGGTLVIPSFAVGRTQEILYEINRYKENDMLGEFHNIRVIVDSPLAVKSTEIFKKYYDIMDKATQDTVKSGDDPLVFDNLEYSLTAETSKAINFDESPKIIISASGMCDAGRIRHHIKHNVFKENCTILLIGYQAEGSLGRLLVEGAKDIKLFGERLAVKAEIQVIDYFSGHADQTGLLNWLKGFEVKPKRVVLVHGEIEGLVPLKQAVSELGMSCVIAQYMTTLDLDNFDSYSQDHVEVKEAVKSEKTPKASQLAQQAKVLFEKLQTKEANLDNAEYDKIKLLLGCVEDLLK